MDGHAIEPPVAATRTRPRLGDFFRASLLLGVVGFGGGLSVLANIHTLAVTKRHWMTEREFTNTITVAQMLPGGAAANAMAYTGLRFGGLKGAFLGYVGFVVPGWIAVMALAFLYVHFGATPDVATLLGGFNAAVVGVIGAITLKMARTAVGRLWQLGVAAGALLFSVLGEAPPGSGRTVAASRSCRTSSRWSSASIGSASGSSRTPWRSASSRPAPCFCSPPSSGTCATVGSVPWWRPSVSSPRRSRWWLPRAPGSIGSARGGPSGRRCAGSPQRCWA